MKHLLLLLIVLFCSVGAFGQTYKVHSLYIYKFARSTSWPEADQTRPLVITIVGDAELANELRNQTKNKSVAGRSIDVVSVPFSNSLPKCDIVYIGAKFNNKFCSLIRTQNNSKMLVLSAMPGQCRNGACIAFAKEGADKDYEICEANIARNGLHMNRNIFEKGRAVQ